MSNSTNSQPISENTVIEPDITESPSYINTSLHEYFPITSPSSPPSINETFHSITAPPNNQFTNTNTLSLPSINTAKIHQDSHQEQNETNWEKNAKDNVAYGSSIDHKDKDVMRLYFQNLHGIKKSHTWHDLQHSIPVLHTWGVDIMGYSETNINWNTREENSVKFNYRESYKHSIISTSNSKETSHSSYQQGGTATIITNKFTGRVIENLSDTTGLGRWSGYRLRCSKTKHLSIITAYCPIVDSKYDSGTCYQQQWRILNSSTTTWVEPRATMLRDLQDHIMTLIAKQDEIILMWDANNILSSTELSNFLQATKLYDLMPETPPRFSTYSRGSRIIDHMWGTNAIKQNIKQAGYLSFNDKAWISDHRGLYIDLDITTLFANKLYNIPRRPARTLTCNNKKAIIKFLDHIDQQDEINSLLEQSYQLRQISNWTTAQQEHLEKIDQNLTTLLLAAEQSLHSNAALPWSPEMHKLFLIFTYWRKYNSGKKNRQKLNEDTRNILHKIGDGVYMDNIQRHSRQQLRLATKRWRKVQTEAFEARQQHLYERQELAVKSKKPDQARIIANLRRCERKRRVYSHIETMNKPSKSNGGLSYIFTKDNKGNISRIDDIEEMNTLLYHRNRKHFAQAHHTPCTTPNVIDHIGESGTTPTAQHILQGHIPDTLPNELRSLFAETNANLPSVELNFTLDDMIAGFAHWKEQTTTSPSGRHLGIYKALVNAHRTKLKTTVEEENDKKQQNNPNSASNEHTILFVTKILQLINNITNTAIIHSVVLPRWTTVHNFFLEKIPGQPLIDKLRVIHIFEADYNLILKHFISRLTLRNAVKHNIIAPEQAGGRPHRTAIDEAVRTTITYEICQLQRYHGGVMYNDAKACFDRIIENVSNLTCLNAGAPIEILDLHYNTLKTVKYIIKHKYGLSPHINGHMNPDPFYGIGQGAGDSTTRWGFISDAIIKCYNRHSHAAHITSAISLIYSDNRVQAFVDDSRLFIICTNAEAIDIYNYLQSDVALWEKLLNATGAKLELDKCKFFVFTWIFDDDGTPHLQPLHHPTAMQIQDSETHESVNVQSMDLTDSYKVLGVPISFTGNTESQVKILTTNVQHLIRVFNKVTLNHDDLLLGYNTVAIPKLFYPLPATIIPSNQLRKLQDNLTYNILPRIGYNRSFPRAIVHAPKYFGGLALHDIESQQGISHITSIIGHYRARTSLAIQYTQLLEAYIINSGLGTSPLEHPQRLSYIKSPWLEIAIMFLTQMNAYIHINSISTIPIIREYDDYIMKYALQWTSVPEALYSINQCRLYLQVTTIAEISTTSGTHLLEWIVTPTSDNIAIFKSTSTSKLHWPIQVNPSQRVWKTWNMFLCSIVRPMTITMLKIPLGKWFTNYKVQRTWTYLSNVDYIIEQKTPSPIIWIQSNRTNFHVSYHTSHIITLPSAFSDTAIPVYPEQHRNHLRLAITNRHQFLSSKYLCSYVAPNTIAPTQTNHTGQLNLTTIPPDIAKYLEYAHTLTSESFSNLLQSSNVYITIGYSIQLNNISSGWTIANDSTILFTGKLLHKSASTNSKLRALTIGAIASLYHYLTIYDSHHCPRPNPKIIICTKETLLQNTLTNWRYTMPTASKQFYHEQENIKALYHLIKQSFRNSTFSIPNDYEDNLYTTLKDHLNISVRHAYNATSMCRVFQNPTTEFHQATLYINTKEINAHTSLELQSAVHTPNLREYFRDKYQWDSKTIQLIDWEIHHHALKGFRSTKRKTLLQFIHRWLPTNAHPASANPLTTLCTVCNIYNESNDHFIACNHQHYQVAWEADIQIWYDTATNLNLDPILTHYLILTLQDWTIFDSVSNIEFCEGTYKKLYVEQHTIGWQHVLHGRLSTTWVDIQNDYLQDSTSKGMDIISSCIAHLFNLILNRWKTRCHHQHGQCISSDNNIRENVLFPKVRALYEQSEQLSANKRQYFNISISNILLKPTKALKQWITCTERIFKASIKHNTKASKSRINSISNFFPSCNPISARQSTHVQSTRPLQTSMTSSLSVIPTPIPTPTQPQLRRPPVTNTLNPKIKRNSQSVRRRFTRAKRKNQPKRKKPLQPTLRVPHIMPRPPPEPDPPNIALNLSSLLYKPP